MTTSKVPSETCELMLQRAEDLLRSLQAYLAVAEVVEHQTNLDYTCNAWNNSLYIGYMQAQLLCSTLETLLVTAEQSMMTTRRAG